jgi:hypothetical protein
MGRGRGSGLQRGRGRWRAPTGAALSSPSPSSTPTMPVAAAVELALRLNKNLHQCYRSQSRLPINHNDISNNFLFRGLYALQLASCASALAAPFPASVAAILGEEGLIRVLDSQQLRQRPAETMAAVEAHLGLNPQGASFYTRLSNSVPNGTSSSSHSPPSLLHHLHEHLYPEFAAESGWSSRSYYPPMPAALRASVAAFYRPFDELLFAILERRLEWGTP